MKTEKIKRDVEELIQELMFKENYELHFDGKSKIGDNYAGEIIFLRVITKDDKKAYNLVVKTAKRSKELTEFIPVELVYNREVFIFAKIYPTYRKLAEETKTGLSLDFVPKVYLISDTSYKQTLIFENLKSRGFKLHDRRHPWSLDHSLLAMERYGELHALSFALRDQRPNEYNELAGQMPSVAVEFNKTMDAKAFVGQPLNTVIELLRKSERANLAKKYDGFIDEAVGIMNHTDEEKGDTLLIGHMDCWNNSFMFEYQDGDDSKPSSICLLDFQLSVPCSPVKDLSYNMYTTCDKSCLDHFEQILMTYYTSLSRNLERLGSKPEDIFTFEQLKEHWRKYAKFGLITAFLVLKICLVEKEDQISMISRRRQGIRRHSQRYSILSSKMRRSTTGGFRMCSYLLARIFFEGNNE